MLYVTLKDGPPRPVLCCDVCHKQIERLMFADAVFPTSFVVEGQLARVLLVHRDACAELALSMLRDQSGASGCLSLQQYLDSLVSSDVPAS